MKALRRRQPTSKSSDRGDASGPGAPESSNTIAGEEGQTLIRNLHLGPTAAVAIVRLADWRLSAISRGLEMALGYLPGELDDACLRDVLADADDSARVAESVAGEERPGNMAVSLLNADGERAPAMAWVLRLEAGDAANLLMVFTPLPKGEGTGAVSGEDPVTGLGARRYFSRRLAAALRTADARQELVGCLIVQLDNIGTAYSEDGESVGEEAIAVIARRLQHGVRSYDSVARLGSDRLGVVLERLELPVHALRAAQHVNHALAEAIAFPGASVRPRVVIGVAVYPSDADSVGRVFRRASVAMHTARNRDSGNVVCAVTPA
ncbi:GGDEF domain-containing protein [Sediminicurvatus halobius]|nr:GGDEF domain-containing protein [Spiribacter halobius]UEX79226.1 GGDEF domain-containing protein [Spiribacter halobius]